MGGGSIELLKLILLRKQFGNCSGFELNAGLHRFVWGWGMDQRKLYNLPGLAEMSNGLWRYLKPERDSLGCPRAHSLSDGAEDDGEKGMFCRGRFGLAASTAACWSRNCLHVGTALR